MIAAFNVPLGADEAYYWTWSLHPAFGYTDHPPMVAWLIWLGTRLGQEPGFVRLPFVLCEAVAALAVGYAARLLSGDTRAGMCAAVLFALIPQTKLAVGNALPDGPYMAGWALALWAAVALERRPSWRLGALLGLALALTLLSRIFGWALVFGILMWALFPARRSMLRYVALALAVAVVAYLPFVWWNATTGWENFAFTFHRRQTIGAASAARLLDVSTLRFLLYGGLLALATWWVALRTRPRVTLAAWTALPLPAALFALSFSMTVESYWIVGPAASFALAGGIALARARALWRRGWFGLLGAGTGYATVAALFWALPETAQAGVFSATPSLRAPLASSAFVYAQLARELRRLAPGTGAAILTDRYETAAELRWYGLDARIVAAIPQQAQWMRWHAGAPIPQQALLVTFASPLDAQPGLLANVGSAFARASTGSVLTFEHAGIAEDRFYVTRLAAPRPNARELLPGL